MSDFLAIQVLQGKKVKKIRLTVEQFMALCSFFNNLCVKSGGVSGDFNSDDSASGAVNTINAACEKSRRVPFEPVLLETFLKEFFGRFGFSSPGLKKTPVNEAKEGPNRSSKNENVNKFFASRKTPSVLNSNLASCLETQLGILSSLCLKSLGEVKVEKEGPQRSSRNENVNKVFALRKTPSVLNSNLIPCPETQLSILSSLYLKNLGKVKVEKESRSQRSSRNENVSKVFALRKTPSVINSNLAPCPETQLSILSSLYLKNLGEVKVEGVGLYFENGLAVSLAVKFSCGIVKRSKLSFSSPLNFSELNCLEKLLKEKFCKLSIEKLTASFMQNIIAESNGFVLHLPSILSEIQRVIDCFLKEKFCFLNALGSMFGLFVGFDALKFKKPMKKIGADARSACCASNVRQMVSKSVSRKRSCVGSNNFDLNFCRNLNVPVNCGKLPRRVSINVTRPTQIKDPLAVPDAVYFSFFLSNLFNYILNLKGTT